MKTLKGCLIVILMLLWDGMAFSYKWILPVPICVLLIIIHILLIFRCVYFIIKRHRHK
jgi:cytochrome c oxidase subunit IV